MRRANHLHSRTLILELDSILQAQRLQVSDGDTPASLRQAIRTLTGMVRATYLIHDRILVTDSMLLDGAFFLHMPPAALAQALDVPVSELPLTVICQASTLAQSLSTKRANKNFKWQLQELGCDTNRVQGHWDAWLGVADTLELEPYGAFGDFQPPAEAWRQQLTPQAREFLAEVEHLRDRSSFQRAQERASQQAPDGLVSSEIESVRTWWLGSYSVATAVAVDANWIRFDAPERSRDGFPRHARHGRMRLHLSVSFTELVTEMPSSVYGLVRHASATPRERLKQRPSRARMNDLMFSIRDPLRRRSRSGVLLGAAARLVIAVLALLLALPQTGSIPSWILWLGVLTTALATIPWDAVAELFDSLKPQRPILSIRFEEEA